MTGITTHVLDTSRGRPAAGVRIRLERVGGSNDRNRLVGEATTDEHGRSTLPRPAERATYRLIFDTGAYFKSQGTAAFYPEVTITFDVTNPEEHYHVPLLVSPFGYSTYRGT